VEHWLVDLATFSGVPVPPDIPAEPTPGELDHAWATIAYATGIHQDELAVRIAGHFRMAVADLSSAQGPALKLVPGEVVRRYCVFPLEATDEEIVVASPDPRDRRAQKELAAMTGRTVVFQVASPGSIMEAIKRYYAPGAFMEHVVSNVISDTEDREVEVVQDQAEALTDFEMEAPAVVKLTRLILDQLAAEDVTELHIEPERDGGRVRVRAGGEVRHFMHLPLPALNRVVFRLKKLAGLNVEDHVTPQRGTIQVAVRGDDRELCVVTVPGLTGERLSVLSEEPDFDYFIQEMMQTVALAQQNPSKGCVLVVDDDASSRLLMRAVLEKLGFDVMDAEDGPPALALLDELGDVSLVMLDLNMPLMHGREVLRDIRGSIGTAGLPVVVLTGVEDPDVEIELLGAGADDFLRKPIDPERLAVRVEAVLRRSGSYEPWPDSGEA